MNKGRRVEARQDQAIHLALGEYGQDENGIWFARPPKDFIETELVANLTKHQVLEHDDGTITVSPSIEITAYYGEHQLRWHGYLERGVWREC